MLLLDHKLEKNDSGRTKSPQLLKAVSKLVVHVQELDSILGTRFLKIGLLNPSVVTEVKVLLQ